MREPTFRGCLCAAHAMHSNDEGEADVCFHSWSHPPSPAHERALLTSLATLMRLRASESNGDSTLLISRTTAALCVG
jgi:hypothetical protein